MNKEMFVTIDDLEKKLYTVNLKQMFDCLQKYELIGKKKVYYKNEYIKNKSKKLL